MFINYTHSSCRATSQHVPFLEYLEHCFPHPRGRRHDGHAGGFQGGYFVPGAALAARDYGASMSHASTGGRGEAGDEGHHWFLRAAVYDKLRGFLLRGTSDFANHDDALGLRIQHELFQAIHEVGAVEWVAADPHHGALPQPRHRGLVNCFVRQCTAPTHHPNPAWLVNVPGHDSDFTLPGFYYSRAVGPDEARFGLRHHRLLHSDHVVLRNPFRDAHHQIHLRLNGFQNSLHGERGWDVNRAGVGARHGLRLQNGVKHGQPEMRGAAFFGGHPANHLRAVRDGLFAVEGSVFPGKSLYDHLGVLINEHRGLGGVPASEGLR